MKGKKIKFEKSRYAEKTDYGGYVEKFEYDFSKRYFWSVSYSIEIKRWSTRRQPNNYLR
jgi:hypothetical protein